MFGHSTSRRIRSRWRSCGGSGSNGVKACPSSSESPYRSVLEPLITYINDLEAREPDAYVTIVLPEFVPARWWQHLLHNQRALILKGTLLFRPNTVVTNVPF